MSRQTTPHTKLGLLMRRERGTMGKVAGVTGINYITLSKYVNGHKPIIPKHAFLLAEYFNVQPEDLYGLVDPPNLGDHAEFAPIDKEIR